LSVCSKSVLAAAEVGFTELMQDLVNADMYRWVLQLL
jgi:hypothetical protein